MGIRPAACVAAAAIPQAVSGASCSAASRTPSAQTPPEAGAIAPFLMLLLHGHGIELTVRVPKVARVASAILGPLIEPFLGADPEVRGAVVPFDEPEVLRQLSPDAVRVDEPDLLLELYRDPRGGERVWLIDERWGVCEINLLKRTWKSWVLPTSRLDAVRLFEASVMWPMAQLLRASGLHIIPAAAAGRGGHGVLILAPFDVGPELDALASAGVGIIGQRWTALRSENDRISLLSVPGRIEPPPRLTSAKPAEQPAWVDVAAGRACERANCELVLLVEPMRRTAASVTALSGAEARDQLKMLWPIPQLSAGASATVTPNVIATTLARTCPVQRVRLSRNGADLAQMLVRHAAKAAA